MDKFDTAQRKTLKLSDIVVNNGQIEGLPRNPRFIRDNKYKALVKSLKDDPEMMDLREILVYPHQGKYVIIGGNMRYRAAKELGWKEIPCKIIPETVTPDKLRAYTIKDNNQFGEWDWDIANNEWDVDEWKDWGIDFFGFDDKDDDDFRKVDKDDSSVPNELKGMDITPDELEKIAGDDKTKFERIIIVYKKDMEQDVCDLIGVSQIDKVVYNIADILNKE